MNKARIKTLKVLKIMVGTTGFEPATSSVSTDPRDCNSLKTKRTDGAQIARKHPFLAFSTEITPEISERKRSTEPCPRIEPVHETFRPRADAFVGQRHFGTIGARNLYIADIMDVNESGESRRPFGRVFYTKTKSLIF